MRTVTLRFAALGAALALGATGAYWYWSPLLAMNSMKTAADQRDADAFNQYVDYAKLRESLKGQFSARLADVVGDSSRAGAALGTLLGMAFVDRMIDAMVRPEMVMKAMAEAKLQDPTSRDRQGPAETAPRNEVEWVLERKGTDRIIAYGARPKDRPAPPAERVGFVFDRSGFATWKLTEIRLPADR